ncbi:diadenylate cyclase CdaA [Trichlorobacter ammonificans]|uniref:Diadenylate cyclase n=1 Tax=Trichlorobacter ammonificans TaxID=2916410 RepID=A0ABN8HGG5_9BACT|nr:diadenylate cyclase CdaA [Trichlorobacter ammonificans]CAH2030059.1 Diadenylate cyclase [Trichlorobacter ammonificans]
MPQFRPQDFLDILIMSILIYQLYSWFRTSRALQALTGLAVIAAIYFVTRQAGLHMTSWILQQLGTVLIILVVVVFQNEIRQALYRFSRVRELAGGGDAVPACSSATRIAQTAFDLAGEHCGALIVIERKDLLDEHIRNGTTIDALISPPLIHNIFMDKTPLHDGALLIRNGRIAQASCHLPLSDDHQLPQQYGTRHRAALGLSERTDALVVVVSEERGEVSLAEGTQLTPMGDARQLEERLTELLAPPDPKSESPLLRRVLRNLPLKAAIVLAVSAVWLVFSLRQGEVAIIQVPLTFHGLPGGMSLTRVAPEELTVRLRSTSGLAPSPRQLDLTADLDLAGVHEGVNALAVSRSNVRVPPGMAVVGVEPAAVRVVIKAIPAARKPHRP